MTTTELEQFLDSERALLPSPTLGPSTVTLGDFVSQEEFDVLLVRGDSLLSECQALLDSFSDSLSAAGYSVTRRVIRPSDVVNWIAREDASSHRTFTSISDVCVLDTTKNSLVRYAFDQEA